MVASVAAAKIDEGQSIELEVRVYRSDGWEMQMQPPQGEGLVFDLVAHEPVVEEGTRHVQISRYRVTGEPGSHVIFPGAAMATGAGEQVRELKPAPIFIDIGVDGPVSPMAGFESPPPPPTTPWGWILSGGVLIAALLGLLIWRLRKPKPEPAPEPLRDRVLRLWSEARQAAEPDPKMALRLSAVMREYLQLRYDWPASAGTTREVLAYLSDRRDFNQELRDDLTRVLQANDRLKFAREGGGVEFFDELEDCFIAVIEAGEAPSPTQGLQDV